jgi:hypothetical protein
LYLVPAEIRADASSLCERPSEAASAARQNSSMEIPDNSLRCVAASSVSLVEEIAVAALISAKPGETESNFPLYSGRGRLYRAFHRQAARGE